MVPYRVCVPGFAVIPTVLFYVAIEFANSATLNASLPDSVAPWIVDDLERRLRTLRGDSRCDNLCVGCSPHFRKWRSIHLLGPFVRLLLSYVSVAALDLHYRLIYRSMMRIMLAITVEK